jgi:CheY-like chemotaxis protein
MSKISVLVVDDASFIRDLVKKCLRNYFPGIRTEDAINGKKPSNWYCETGRCRKCPVSNC